MLCGCYSCGFQEGQIAITFTDEGVKKARDLSIAQKGKLVALVVDNKVVWAPRVQSEIAKESVLTGNTPTGVESGRSGADHVHSAVIK
jgi:preprotein translocase subunit SecD